MLMLNLVRNFTPAHEMIERGEWDVSEVARNAFDVCKAGQISALKTLTRLLQLEGKTIGTIGAGRIGFHVLKRLVPFAPKELLYYDYAGLSPEREKEVSARKVDSLEEFVSECDVVVSP